MVCRRIQIISNLNLQKAFIVSFIAIALSGLLWFGYQHFLLVRISDQADYFAGNRSFEDGDYLTANKNYKKAIANNPNNLHAKRGLARSLMQLGNHQQALQIFNEVIALEPDFAVSIANRGILHDKMKSYELAIQDYQRALQLEPKLAKGPSWLTRFLRNQAKKPPSIADRLAYLQNELQKPINERLLAIPDKDKEQRPFKY